MIYFDLTKAGGAGHRSGLMRVSTRLAQELGAAATPVRWPLTAVPGSATDWFLTGELFSEEERPGVTAFLDARRCRTAAIFHDAIPLKFPHVTWPQSVARHPGYMKLLAKFDRVWAVSEASRRELEGFWQWQGVERRPTVEVLSLGADFAGSPRVTDRASAAAVPQLLCVGIIEPRKNQAFLLDVCEKLWSDGMQFELHFIGRVNPHFGRPIVARMRALRRRFGEALQFHEAAGDGELARRFTLARVTLFPTIAEGCGLPLLESLWQGVPCLCSDLPVLRENADDGGCVAIPVDDRAAWGDAIRRVVADEAFAAQLAAAAVTRSLPTWHDAAQTLTRALT
jgi:glycosyltransferase involved in cell wall biosynthesis